MLDLLSIFLAEIFFVEYHLDATITTVTSAGHGSKTTLLSERILSTLPIILADKYDKSNTQHLNCQPPRINTYVL